MAAHEELVSRRIRIIGPQGVKKKTVIGEVFAKNEELGTTAGTRCRTGIRE